MKEYIQSKIQNIHVTDKSLHYEGSVTICRNLMSKVNLEPFQKVDVWQGKVDKIDVYTDQDVYKTIKKAKKKLLKVSVKYEGPVEAPIQKGEKVAILKVVYDDEIVGEYDLLASKEVKKVNFVSRLLKSLNYLIWGDV